MSDVATIGPDEAHLWVVDPGELERTGHLSWYSGMLSPPERERLRQFSFERDRLAFLAGRGLARTALSACVPSVPPQAWEFAYTMFGRPEVAAPRVRPVLRFNISHTHRLVACLVVAEVDCGVDVEALDRAADVNGLADRVLSPAEHATLSALPDQVRPALFFRYWTLKEAYLKARGCGISMPLDKCAFEFSPNGIRAWFDAPLDDDSTKWQFVQWSPREGHLLAVALHRGRAAAYRIVRHALPPGLSPAAALALPLTPAAGAPPALPESK
jgi:4'-phosphopantetheinyl transferase